MAQELRRFLRDEMGPELVEWAVVTIILLVAAVAAYRLVGDRLREILDKIAAYLVAVRGGTALP